MPNLNHVPAYKLHKPSGQARVIIWGRHRYLGRFGSPESKEAYSRLIGELAVTPESVPIREVTTRDFLVVQLLAAYWEWAQTYYVKGGKLSGHLPMVRAAMRVLRSSYGTEPATEVGPLALMAIQNQLVQAGKSRSYVNSMTDIIR